MREVISAGNLNDIYKKLKKQSIEQTLFAWIRLCCCEADVEELDLMMQLLSVIRKEKIEAAQNNTEG